MNGLQFVPSVNIPCKPPFVARLFCVASGPNPPNGNVLAHAWREFRPRLIAWLVDTWTAILVWAGIAIVHLIQRSVLSFGWIPGIVQFLNIFEETIAAATVAVFLLNSFFSFSWVSLEVS